MKTPGSSQNRASGRLVGALGLAVVALGAMGASEVREDASFRFEPGHVLGHKELETLRDWFPPPFWAHRQHFFFEGIRMEVGPPHRDYSPPAAYRDATQRNRGKASVGPDGTLLGYVSGQPFPMAEIQCKADPQAGTKIIWNFVHRWQGAGVQADFRYTYWDRGEQLPLRYRGTTSAWLLKHRPEPQFEATGGDVFEDELRYAVVGFEIDDPPEYAGTRTLTYRYAKSFGTLDEFQPEDTWVYLREIRRIRKVSQTQRHSAISGTDFSFDDLMTFSGLPAQYEWKCLGNTNVLAPMNTTVAGYPYDENGQFGPSGLSYGSDRWELRRAIRLEMTPKDDEHPYSKKEIWIDSQTLQPLYSFAYDRKGALWKIIYHNHRWSEDDLGPVKARDWYPGWENVPEPRDLRIVSEAIFNVQTGTGNRLDFWNSRGTPLNPRSLRRYVDIQRLRRGR